MGIVKLTYSDLHKIVRRVIKESEEKKQNGRYFSLFGKIFYFDGENMYLAKKEDGQELKPDMSVKFPSSDEIGIKWTENTQEVENPESKVQDLKNFGLTSDMQNSVTYADMVKDNVNIGNEQIPIIFYSLKKRRPVIAGMTVSTDFNDSADEDLHPVKTVRGNEIFYEQSYFEGKKKYGIRLKIHETGMELNLEDFGISKNNLKLPKSYNIAEFFQDNESKPKNLHRASFVESIKKFLQDGGEINRVTVEASTSRIPAGCKNNDCNQGKWKEITEYDDVFGNNDDRTGNLQLSKARAKETYNCLMDTLPQLKSAPYIIKGSGHKGNYVHIKFE
jgi:hypothetical protein